MNVGRVGFLIAALTAIALVVVHLRAERTRCAARIVALESDWIQLRRELWVLQTRTARLKTPQRLRDRVVSLPTDLAAPAAEIESQPAARLASDRP